MKKIAAVSLAILLIALDAVAATKGTTKGNGTAPKSKAATQTIIPTPAVHPGDRFEIDAVDLRTRLSSLAEDERREQIADWVVYATLVHTQASAKLIRDVLYDRPPMRLPALEETVNFDYGPGRRVVMPDRTVWLFRSELDAHPQATLARLADQARMELGEKPRSFTVFVYRTTLTEGTIEVHVDGVVPETEIYSTAYGYVESRIRDLHDLTDWLSRVDDVVHVRTMKDGTLELAGRRHADAPTSGVTLEHVAALYQAHRRLAESHKEVVTEAIDAALVEAINRNYELASEQKALDNDAFVHAASNWVQMLDSSSRAFRAAGYDGAGPTVPITDLRSATTAETQEAVYKRLIASTEVLLRAQWKIPSEPGFSLDWSFNGKGLVRDLRSILENPAPLIAEAQALAETESTYQPSARPSAVWAAIDFTEAVEDDFKLTPPQREQIIDVLDGISASDNLQDYQLQAFQGLLRQLTTSPEGIPLAALLQYVNVKNACQCARYDGPLQGTLVGMNLFYTDLLAKLWASVDYYEKAPVTEVVGFRSKPQLSVEPTYWKEVRDKPATRLWFGPKAESYSVSTDGGEVNFAHIATRVFSRGSGIDSRKESPPAEPSRRVYHWWDRHYAYIADYEQQYHVQNQIMKWSVITGWAVENDLLAFLDFKGIPIQRDLRFDSWYASNDTLRFRDETRMLPESEWRGTECMELLRSYPFDGGSKSAYILGGVSLASRDATKAEGAILAKEVAPAVRRAGLVKDIKGALRSVSKETEYTLPRDSLKTFIKQDTSTATRSAGTQLNASGFQTSVANSGTTGQVRIATDHYELGAIQYERVDGGVRLGTKPGEVEVAEKLTTAIADANDLGIPFAALENSYYIGNPRGGFDVIAKFSQGSKQTAFELTIGKEPRGLMHAGFGESGEFVVSAKPIKVAEATSRLDSQSWQRLNTDGFVLNRLFTNQGPSPTATSLKLRLTSGTELDTFVDQGTVYVRRPTMGAEGFEALVEREEITRDFIEVIAQRQKTDDILLTPALSMRPKYVGKPMDVGALNELADAARRGDLDNALRKFRTKYSDTAWKDLGGSTTPPLTPSDGLQADLLIAKTLTDARQRNFQSAADSLRQALPAGAPSDQMLNMLHHADGIRELGVISDVANVRATGASADFLQHLEIRANSRQLQSAVILDKGKMTATPVDNEAQTVRFTQNRRDVFYVDQQLLTRYDWDSMPGNSLHRAMKDPHIVIEVLEIDGIGEFRPSLLIEGQQSFIGLRTGSDYQVESIKEIIEPARVIRLHYQPCDQNTDPDCNEDAA